jgi:drug/metabolite transporter (DMT)-like permease
VLAAATISQNWYVFALLASLAWSVVQLVDKTLISSQAPSSNHYLVISGMTTVVSLLVLPLVATHDLSVPTTLTLIGSIGAGVCYFASNGFFFRALNNIDASVNSAVLATTPGLTAIGSWLILGQDLGWPEVTGVIAISVGVLIMSQFGRGKATNRPPASAWMSICIAELLLVTEYILEGVVVEHIPALDVLFWSRVGVVMATAAFAVVRWRLVVEAVSWAFSRSRHVAALSAANECLDIVAIGLLITAYSRGPIGVATALAYTQAAFVFGISLLVNAIRPKTIPTEGDDVHASGLGWRAVGIVIVIAGVFLALL